MEPHDLLGRVLRHEVDTSSLLAYLIARDPRPLQSLLKLPEPIRDVRVEVQHTTRNRMDVVLDGQRGPIAVIELKVAATEHGDQLKRYDEFAAPYDAARFLVDLELEDATVPAGWTRFSLEEVFGRWAGSSDHVATALGPEIAAVFAQWRAKANGPLAQVDAAMLGVVLRQVRDHLKADGYTAHATGTAAGQPSLTVFTQHPSGHDRAYLCVDVRCQDKTDPGRPWLFRAGVHINTGDDLAADRRLANQLAVQLLPAFQPGRLERAVCHDLADDGPRVLSGAQPVKTPRDVDGRVRAWLDAVDSAVDGTVPRHPVFHHDWGRRLAARYTVDTHQVRGRDLEDLAARTLGYLTKQANR